MFEAGGTCYVYLSYGMHFCMNVSTGPKGVGEAILLRAGVTLVGLPQMLKNRGFKEATPVVLRSLLNGPGKLTQALGIDRKHNGERFDRSGLKLVDLGLRVPKRDIFKTPRIGITKAADLPYRFYFSPAASKAWVEEPSIL
jgi:DNA-3-methyladenine glycosylase